MRRLLMNRVGSRWKKIVKSIRSPPSTWLCPAEMYLISAASTRGQILLRDHPSRSKTRVARISGKTVPGAAQQPGDGRDVSRATGQHLPIKRDPSPLTPEPAPHDLGVLLAVPHFISIQRAPLTWCWTSRRTGVHRLGPLVCQAWNRCWQRLPGGVRWRLIPEDTRGIDQIPVDRPGARARRYRETSRGFGLGGGVDTAIEREDAGPSWRLRALLPGGRKTVSNCHPARRHGDGDIEVSVTGVTVRSWAW